MDAYVIVFLLSGVLGAFAFERLMRVFFEEKRYSTFVVIIVYILWYIITCTVYLLIRVPAIQAITSITMYYVITLLYKSSLLRRLIATVGSFVFIVTIESLILFVTIRVPQSLFHTIDSPGIPAYIILGPLSYSLAVMLQKFKNLKQDLTMHPLHILTAISIPCASIFLSCIIVGATNVSQAMGIVSIVIIFSINIITFSLQDALAIAYRDQLLSKIHAQEKEYYLAQCHMMTESVESMKAFRHDTNLHFGTLENMALKKDIVAISSYLKNLLDHVNSDGIYCDTGNTAFDSIINYKLRSANEKNIKIALELSHIPDNCMDVPDITSILGNLIDNALDAVALVEEKWINLSVVYLKGTLQIEISNPFNGIIQTEQHHGKLLNVIKSSKQNPGHGYGLKNIKKAVLNYNGDIDIAYDDNLFTVTIFLFTKS